MSNKSLSEVNSTVITNQNKGWKRIFSFIGPAFLVSVGYMDPGNWATDIAAGSSFGYSLLWVLLMSNFIAIILQYLSAKLGIVAGKDLAQITKEMFPPIISKTLWVLAELAIAACDLAEVLGMAIGLKLLFGTPLIIGVFITLLDTFILLALQNYGIRKLESFIFVLILTIGICFGIQLALAQPELAAMASGLIPNLPNEKALYLAIGVIGATVMPHNLYLHSALVQSRKIDNTDNSKRIALKFNFIDSVVALNLALFVNGALMILAASTFYNNGFLGVAKIEEAHSMLAPLLGSSLAPILFAIALIAAGQSSTITGTLAGQVVMEGFVNIRVRPWLRRIITRGIAIVPAAFTILYFGDAKAESLLIVSQVILSLQLGFAIIPILHITARKHYMGVFANRMWLTIIGIIIAIIIIGLNLKMVVNEIKTLEIIPFYLAVTGLVVACMLLAFTIIYPLFIKRIKLEKQLPHAKASELIVVNSNVFRKIAITIDFSKFDNKVINQAVATGGLDATYVLIHVTETPAALVYNTQSQDYETNSDKLNLELYQTQLEQLNYKVSVMMGYGDAVKNICKIVKKENCDLLVMAQHKHTGIKDIVYGQTINTVRHQLDIPLLIV
jgi:manganese transport protein